MGVFHQEDPPNPSKKCKFLKDALSNCRFCGGRFSTSSPEEECPTSDIDEEQEVIVSEIRSRAMEKTRHKPFILTDSFSWVFSPKTGELFLSPKPVKGEEYDEDGCDDEDEAYDGREEFFSVGTCLSCCSSVLSREAFFSVKTNFSRCSSFKKLEFKDYFHKLDIEDLRRRSIIQEFCHCEGWPFGLCRKALLLPPLPKSPSESWTWRKGTKQVKLP